MVSMWVLAFAAFASVAPAVAVEASLRSSGLLENYDISEHDGNQMRVHKRAASTEEELRLALEVAEVELAAARTDALALAAARVELEATLTAREELTGRLEAALSAACEQAHSIPAHLDVCETVKWLFNKHEPSTVTEHIHSDVEDTSAFTKRKQLGTSMALAVSW